MTGLELLKELQALKDEVLAEHIVIRHSNGGFSEVDRLEVLYIGRIALHLAPPPTEAESKAALKEAEDRLWAGSHTEDGSVAAVDPADLKNVWKLQSDASAHAKEHHIGQPVAIDVRIFAEACTPGVDVTAVWYRVSMLRLLAEHRVLSPWLHDGKPDDVLFNLAAKFPMKRMPVGVPQQGPPFDLNEFLKQIA